MRRALKAHLAGRAARGGAKERSETAPPAKPAEPLWSAPGRRLRDKPALGVLIGAFAIAFSGILYRKANVSPSTGAFFRCLWALPPLWLLAVREDRRMGARPIAVRRAAWLAGAFFAADLILWHYSIEYVGAGLATVLGNTQVVIVGLLAWALIKSGQAL